MLDCFSSSSVSIPIIVIPFSSYEEWLLQQPPILQSWLKTAQSLKKPGDIYLVPNSDGGIQKVLFLKDQSFWDYAILAEKLPPFTYKFETSFSSAIEAEHAVLAWALALYQYPKSQSVDNLYPTLICPDGIDQKKITEIIEATYLIRDLINHPAGHLTPKFFTEEVVARAKDLGAAVEVIENEQLLENNYPTIYAVGKSAPYCSLVDFTWGNLTNPKLTLVGKGVCFDTGGLDIKTAGGMRLMKKDMGGAAHVLALAQLIIKMNLPVRLRVLIPIVENSISPTAMHPGDIIKTRKGLTVEVGHTDAEGRLILCDCLAEADLESPELVIDCATLTGAARVALGPSLPALFGNNQDIINNLLSSANETLDPLWQLPLWSGYHEFIKSKVADLNNDSSSPFGGAITAALFLSRFIEAPWLHIDMMAWNVQSKPGRPEGGEAMGLRALYHFLQQRFC